MARLAAIAANVGTRPRVAIRVNPDFEVRGSAMRMGGGSTQFGVDAERVPSMLRDLASLDLEFTGFHIFSGSQNLDADILARTQEQTIDLALRLAEHAPAPMRHLNIGGGFGIPYFPKDRPFDLDVVGERLGELLTGRVSLALEGTRVIIELGRYIVGESGVYVSRIVDRKESRGQVFLITDGGLHHQLAASGNFGQTIRRNYPVTIGNRMDGTYETVTVVGCLCTPLDLLADKMPLPEAEVRNLVAHCAELESRELVVAALRLLQRHDVDVGSFHPVGEPVDAAADGVDVPGRDAHAAEAIGGHRSAGRGMMAQ